MNWDLVNPEKITNSTRWSVFLSRQNTPECERAAVDMPHSLPVSIRVSKHTPALKDGHEHNELISDQKCCGNRPAASSGSGPGERIQLSSVSETTWIQYSILYVCVEWNPIQCVHLEFKCYSCNNQSTDWCLNTNKSLELIHGFSRAKSPSRIICLFRAIWRLFPFNAPHPLPTIYIIFPDL